MLLRQTIFYALSFQRAHVNSFWSAGLFQGCVLHYFPIMPPDLGVLVIVPIHCVNITAFPFPILVLDAIASFIEHILCPGLREPLAMFVHCPKSQQKMNMGITVAFVVIVKITNHASADKLPLAVVPDQRQILLIGQFLRKDNEHPPGCLSINSFLSGVNRIPECLAVCIFAGSVVRQHDFPIDDSLRAAVGMLPFVITLGIHLLSGVIGRSRHDGLILATYVRYGKRRTRDFVLTSVPQRRAL